MRSGRLLGIVLLGACGGGGASVPDPLVGAPVVVMAGDVVAEPAPWDGTGVDLAPLGIVPEEIDGTFRFTTPARMLFRFEILTTGGASLGIAHPAGGATPVELTKARIFCATPGGGTYAWSPDGGGPVESPWFEAIPDDIARIEVGGSIEAPQTIVVRAGANYALVFLDLGPISAIHPPETTLDDPAPLDEVALASGSDDAFGRPAVAALPAAPVVAWLSGNEYLPADDATYHLRARVEALPPAGSVPVAAPGHDAAGTQQDLLIARAEGGAVTLEYSGSAGTAFEPPQTLDGTGVVRHPALAVAPDRFALAFWRDRDLVLVEGQFPPLVVGPAEVVFTAPEGSIPLQPAVAIRDGVAAVAYAFAHVELDAGLGPIDVSTQSRCLVRGEDDLPVARAGALSRGPGVAITDDGRILCAVDGIRLFERSQGAFLLRESLGGNGAHSPRMVARGASVDVLYLQPTARGAEVHRASAGQGGSVERVTAATRAFRTNGYEGATAWPVYYPQNEPVPWVGFDGWQASGFDAAAVEGGDLIVAVHVERAARLFFILSEPGREVRFLGGEPGPLPPLRVPLPTDPALTGSISEAYELDRHQLRVLRLAE
jgi:hypothetical protein